QTRPLMRHSVVSRRGARLEWTATKTSGELLGTPKRREHIGVKRVTLLAQPTRKRRPRRAYAYAAATNMSALTPCLPWRRGNGGWMAPRRTVPGPSPARSLATAV